MILSYRLINGEKIYTLEKEDSKSVFPAHYKFIKIKPKYKKTN